MIHATYHELANLLSGARPVLERVPDAAVALGPAHVGEDGRLQGVEAVQVRATWNRIR